MKSVFDRSRKSAPKAIATLVVAIIGFFAVARAGYKTVAILILVLGVILAGWLSPKLIGTLGTLAAIAAAAVGIALAQPSQPDIGWHGPKVRLVVDAAEFPKLAEFQKEPSFYLVPTEHPESQETAIPKMRAQLYMFSSEEAGLQEFIDLQAVHKFYLVPQTEILDESSFKDRIGNPNETERIMKDAQRVFSTPPEETEFQEFAAFQKGQSFNLVPAEPLYSKEWTDLQATPSFYLLSYEGTELEEYTSRVAQIYLVPAEDPEFQEFADFLRDLYAGIVKALSDPGQLALILAEVGIVAPAVGLGAKLGKVLGEYILKKLKEWFTNTGNQHGIEIAEKLKQVLDHFENVPKSRLTEISEGTGLPKEQVGAILKLGPFAHELGCFWKLEEE